MDEEHSSKHFNLSDMFRNSHDARKIVQTTEPIFEEFSTWTSLQTVGFSNETEVTYAKSIFSQVGFLWIWLLEHCHSSLDHSYRQDLLLEIIGNLESDSKELREKPSWYVANFIARLGRLTVLWYIFYRLWPPICLRRWTWFSFVHMPECKARYRLWTKCSHILKVAEHSFKEPMPNSP